MSAHTAPRTYRSAVAALRKRRVETLERRSLVAEMDEFRSAADLTELAGILDRHTDAEASPVRDAIDWTRAA